MEQEIYITDCKNPTTKPVKKDNKKTMAVQIGGCIAGLGLGQVLVSNIGKVAKNVHSPVAKISAVAAMFVAQIGTTLLGCYAGKKAAEKI